MYELIFSEVGIIVSEEKGLEAKVFTPIFQHSNTTQDSTTLMATDYGRAFLLQMRAMPAGE